MQAKDGEPDDERPVQVRPEQEQPPARSAIARARQGRCARRIEDDHEEEHAERLRALDGRLVSKSQDVQTDADGGPSGRSAKTAERKPEKDESTSQQ